MKFTFAFLVFNMVFSCAFGKSKIDSALQKRIISMFHEDQLWRREEVNLQNGKISAFDENTINLKMAKADSLNQIEAKTIIRKYGFPGYSLVGEVGSDAFWAIVQHCDDGQRG